MALVDWYAEAVGSGVQSDVIGAVGFAGKHKPLAMALLRLFVGDNGAARDLVGLMGQMVVSKAYRSRVIMPVTQAEDIARSVLAWHRDGVCRPCGGLGYMKIEGSPGLSDHQCMHCRGTRKQPFERQFKPGHIEVAKWLIVEVEREQAIAGREAMRRLNLRIDFE